MADPEIHVPFDLLERFMTDAFRRLGLSHDDAAVSADVLITADKQGIDTHGVSRFKSIYVDRIASGQVNPRAVPEFIRRGPSTAVIDGHNGMGQVVSKAAMTTAMEMARRTGMGMVVARNSNHYGIAGYYVSMAASDGLIGITGTNARPSVSPTFGSEPMLGTNPLAFGIPTDENFPFILDCATSASQRGKIEVAARTGIPVPGGWAVDSRGNDIHDAAVLLKGLNAGTASLLPLGGPGETTGGHKGYGYATVVEILSSGLAGGAFLSGLAGSADDGKPSPLGLGHFFIAVDVAAFRDPASFRRHAGDILRELRASAKVPGRDRIFTAGEKEYAAWLERKEKGVSMDAPLCGEFVKVRDELKLTEYRFPFDS
ncbi:Ldh family oxidoreductase [bacterium]|nr:Ldh family oxidoreductase [bacterium]